MGLSSKTMPIGTFNIRATNGQSMVVQAGDGTDVAARYFVYKLYEATDGQPMQWQLLHGWASQRRPFSKRLSVDGRSPGREGQAADDGRVDGRRAAPGPQGKEEQSGARAFFRKGDSRLSH